MRRIFEGAGTFAQGARELIELLPSARLVEVPGDHGTAAAAPELVRPFVEFLA